jgi:hypothetical protein
MRLGKNSWILMLTMMLYSCGSSPSKNQDTSVHSHTGLQKKLDKAGKGSPQPDGQFGKKKKRAVKEF